MKILGIETSCDDTAISVLEVERGKFKVLSNVVSSQVKLHAKYGGIVPHLAAREHEKNLPRILKLSLKKANIKNIKKQVDLIAVTRGPGLSPALWQGINFAKDLAKKYKIPLIGVNHLEGHIYSNWLESGRKMTKKIFPSLNLIVSGGHAMLVLMRNYGKYRIIGETLDDAVGEAFDKVARMLGLGFPGGPVIAARAEQFKIKNLKLKIKFPRPIIYSKDYNFSYSGLKTAVLYKIRNLKKSGFKLTKNLINQISYEFQNAAIDVLVYKTKKAAQDLKIKSIMLSGGVSANKLLRSELKKISKEIKIKYFQPEMKYTTDNAAMIALAGYFNYKNKKVDQRPIIIAEPNLNFL